MLADVMRREAMIYVVVSIRVKAGKLPEFLGLFGSVVPLVIALDEETVGTPDEAGGEERAEGTKEVGHGRLFRGHGSTPFNGWRGTLRLCQDLDGAALRQSLFLFKE